MAALLVSKTLDSGPAASRNSMSLKHNLERFVWVLLKVEGIPQSGTLTLETCSVFPFRFPVSVAFLPA